MRYIYNIRKRSPHKPRKPKSRKRSSPDRVGRRPLDRVSFFFRDFDFRGLWGLRSGPRVKTEKKLARSGLLTKPLANEKILSHPVGISIAQSGDSSPGRRTLIEFRVYLDVIQQSPTNAKLGKQDMSSKGKFKSNILVPERGGI